MMASDERSKKQARTCLSLRAAWRTRLNPLHTVSRLCVRPALGCAAFSLANRLPSTASASACPRGGLLELFGCFIGTIPLSDSSPACLWGVRLSPSPTGLPLLPTDADEVSRFSCRKFPGVLGVYDRAGPGADSRWRLRRCGLPHQSMASAPETSSFTARYPARRCLCQRFTRMSPAPAHDSARAASSISHFFEKA